MLMKVIIMYGFLSVQTFPLEWKTEMGFATSTTRLSGLSEDAPYFRPNNCTSWRKFLSTISTFLANREDDCPVSWD